MEKNPSQSDQKTNLMDAIASDPDFINRPAQQTETAASSAAPSLQANVSSAEMNEGAPAPRLNLLGPTKPQPTESTPASDNSTVPPRHHHFWPVIAAVLLILSLGGVGYAWYAQNQSASPVVSESSPTPTPSPTPALSVSPSPSPTPSLAPSPSPTPVPQEVIAPAAPPTADKPQVVTVMAGNGLWLRSSPTSANKRNIIGWLPNGAQVSVDQTGEFWWHGTYKGKSGYFAVNYTQR